MPCVPPPGPLLPAVTPVGLCPALSYTSRAAWELVTYGFTRQLAGAPRAIDERAITDVALLIVERLSVGRAHVTLFTAGQEAATGADFELQIFGAAGRRLSFLVQAKALKIDQPNEGYPGPGGKAAGVYQYIRLMASCAPGGAYPGSSPMHLFYNGKLLRSKNTCRSTSAFCRPRWMSKLVASASPTPRHSSRPLRPPLAATEFRA